MVHQGGHTRAGRAGGFEGREGASSEGAAEVAEGVFPRRRAGDPEDAVADLIVVDERAAAGGDATVGGIVAGAVSARTAEPVVSTLSASFRRASASGPEIGVGACFAEGGEACPSVGGMTGSAGVDAACMLANCV